MKRGGGHRKINMDEFYPKVKELVEQGFTIDEACVKAGRSRETFYRYATGEQKTEIRQLKSLQAKHDPSKKK